MVRFARDGSATQKLAVTTIAQQVDMIAHIALALAVTLILGIRFSMLAD